MGASLPASFLKSASNNQTGLAVNLAAASLLLTPSNFIKVSSSSFALAVSKK